MRQQRSVRSWVKWDHLTVGYCVREYQLVLRFTLLCATLIRPSCRLSGPRSHTCLVCDGQLPPQFSRL